MFNNRIWRTLRVGLAALGLAGCAADSPTGPKVPDAASPGLVGDVLDGLIRKEVLTRKTPLGRDITVSAVIGRNGGVLSIPEAGIQVVVPPRAVNKNVRFTLTAVKGKLVAYEFEPHGIRFTEPLVARQDLSKTNYRPLSLRLLTAGYFADRSQLDLQKATALVSEIIAGVTIPLSNEFTWRIEHFSGYIVAW
jgi:hypothetical protein